MMFLFRLKYTINQRANLRLFQYISILIISIGLLSCSKQSSSEDSTFRDKLKLVSLKGEPIDVSRFENKVVILNLWATWCGPCRMLVPELERIAGENKDVLIVKVDVDQAPDVAQEHEVGAIPDIRIYKGGKQVEQVIGFRPADSLLQIIRGS